MISLKKLFHLIDLARQCNKCAMLHFQNLSFNQVKYKNDNSPLTQADLEVNQIAVNGIKKLFPNVKIISEEFKKSHQSFQNNNVFDERMYVGRIQFNLNDGKKRRFLYFQADYNTRK